MWIFLPYQILREDEVITVDQNPWDVAEKENHDNTHENKGKVDLAFYRIPRSNMGIPKSNTNVSSRFVKFQS